MSKTLLVVPVYNGEDFIERTLKSCVSQSVLADILVVDNCSTDSTVFLVRKLIDLYPNIRLTINEVNLGRVGNWNRCIDLFMEAAEYEFLKYVFSGDEILPQCVEETEKILLEHPEVGALGFAYEFVDLAGRKSISHHGETKLYSEKEITYINLAEGMILGAIISNVYVKAHIGTLRFSPNEISKARFDIRLLEHSKLYYLDKVLARFNLDSHQTFDSANSSVGYLEFSFIEADEHSRISKTPMFSQNENNLICQKIIKNCIDHQKKFMTSSTIFVTILALMRFLVLRLLKSGKRLVSDGR